MNDFGACKQQVGKLVGFDLSGYRDAQLQRRLETFAQKRGLANCQLLLNNLRRQPELVRELIDYLDINVSEFFRNRDMFHWLADNVLTALRGRQQLRFWSAGCSIGCEAYTLAILANEVLPRASVEIIGTDIDSEALAQAARGVYKQEHVRNLTRGELEKYFLRKGEEFHLDESIKKRVRFDTLNLLTDPYLKNVDLIVCRNVVIYFTEEAKDRVFSGFAASLRTGGVLFIGATESYFNSGANHMARMAHCFYKKLGGGCD